MSKSLRKLVDSKDYKHAMFNIVSERYGLESAFFSLKNPKRIGLEDIENELEANEEEENSGEPFAPEGTELDNGMGPDMEEAPADPNADLDDYNLGEEEPPTPGDEFSDMSRDGEFGTDDNGNYTVEETEPAWDEGTTMDDLKSDADCINMVKIIGNYTNQYALNMEEFLKTNKEFIDYTGDFKQVDMFNAYVNPAMDVITKMFKDDPVVKHLEGLIEIMTDKRKVLSVCGKPDNPFLYEGMQIVLYDAIRSVLACIPYSIKNNQSLAEVIESMQLNVVKCLIQMVADLVEVAPILGTKIYYVEPVVSEITGKSEEVANTPYATLDVMNRGNESFTGMRLANESIMNLVEIKNNKALVEFSALTKMMCVITGLTKDIDLRDKCIKALEMVLKMASAGSEEVLQDLDSSIEYFRNEVFIPEIKAMASLAAEENAKLTEEPETNVDLNEGTSEIAGDKGESVEVSVPGAELEPETEEEDFDNDL